MLKISNWTIKNFNQENIVLKDINLSFFSNEVVAIIGASGIGKTTLLNSLALHTKILNGSFFYNNEEINFKNKKTIKKFCKNIGYISQKKSLVDDLSVFDNLKLAMSCENNLFMNFFNILTKNQKKEIFQVLEKLGILDKVFYRVRDLSGGESQRVEIAKILISKSKIILADEPTSNLDFLSSSDVISLFNQIAKDQSAIVIINIHNLEQLKNNVDRVIGLKNQGILFDKKPNEILKEDLRILYEK